MFVLNIPGLIYILNDVYMQLSLELKIFLEKIIQPLPKIL